MNAVSNNREEIGAILAGGAMTVFMHYSQGWGPTEVAALTAAASVIVVYLVGFLPKPKA